MSSGFVASSSTASNPVALTRRKFARNVPKQKPLRAKVVMVGNVGVGKTSICLRHDGQGFRSQMSSTLGASFVTSKSVHNGREVHLQIWDTAGQERFRSMVPLYLRGAIAAIIVFDVTDRTSFNDLRVWIDDIERAKCELSAVFVVANKCDLADRRCITVAEAEAFANERNFEYFETSAANGRGVERAMYEMAQTIWRVDSNTSNTNESLALSTPKVAHQFSMDEEERAARKTERDESANDGRSCCAIS